MKNNESQIENPGTLSVATVMLEAFASVMTTAHASQGDGSGSGCQTKSWIWSNETQIAFVGNDSEKSIRKPSQLPTNQRIAAFWEKHRCSQDFVFFFLKFYNRLYVFRVLPI